jgi:hypothetical protein
MDFTVIPAARFPPAESPTSAIVMGEEVEEGPQFMPREEPFVEMTEW